MKTETRQYEIKVQSNLLEDISNHSGRFTAIGVLFLVLGIAAIAFPWTAALSLDLAIGALLVVAGAAQILQSLSGPRGTSFLPSLALGILALIIGALMLFFPLAGAITLASLVMFFLLLTGTVKTLFAFQVRPVSGWGWILTSGLLSLALGLLILFQFTATNVPWILGLLLGVDFLFTGVWILMLVASAKRLS